MAYITKNKPTDDEIHINFEYFFSQEITSGIARDVTDGSDFIVEEDDFGNEWNVNGVFLNLKDNTWRWCWEPLSGLKCDSDGKITESKN